MIRVLIVDDAQLIRSRLTQSIEQYGEATAVAGAAPNGLKALEWLDAYYADLCMTDIRMPVMDGLSLMEEIGNRYPWMRCLVISSYDEFQYAKQSMELNALDYVLKPIGREQLSQVLGQAIERITSARTNEAAGLLLKMLPLHRMRMDEWVSHIETMRTETLPLQIVDTLELLEAWVNGRYDLLIPLANLWLKTVINELPNRKFELSLEEGEDVGLGEKALPVDKVRSYFRLCAVRRLEEGAHRLLAHMRGVRDGQTTRIIDQIKAYIEEHLRDDIHLHPLAQYVNLNRSYMCTLFKQETNQTVWQFIVGQRMKAARDLLLNTQLKVYEIASQVGYEDVKYFSRQFKKHYGLNPAEYKKRMEG